MQGRIKEGWGPGASCECEAPFSSLGLLLIEIKKISVICPTVQHNLVSIFPNVEVVLRIYLSMMVSNCSGERTFSKLKRIKNEVRSTMGETRLNFLSIMSIESNILRDLDFSSIIKTFACQYPERL